MVSGTTFRRLFLLALLSAPVAAAALEGAIRAPAMQLRQEARETEDLKTLFDRYRALPDPTGEIAFALAGIVNECADFAERSFDSYLDAYSRDQRPGVVPDQAGRVAELTRRMSRCAGFKALDSSAVPYALQIAIGRLHDEMHAKALDAGYPGAIARKLAQVANPRHAPEADKLAIHLLGGKVDADVLTGIERYLAMRNARPRSAPRPGGVASHTAWTLLKCDFGAECARGSRDFYMTCLLYGACDLATIDDALRVQTSDDTLRHAHAIRNMLADAIRRQDWEALGFGPE